MTVYFPPDPPPTMEPCVLCGAPAEIQIRVKPPGAPETLVKYPVKTQRCTGEGCAAFDSWRLPVA